MRTFVAPLLLTLIALPAAIWFARDALVSRLNPWAWAGLGFLSVAVPTFLLFRLTAGGIYPQRWMGTISFSIVAVSYFTAYVVHRRALKPKRVSAIGTSLNYVGGWLGTLIFMLFLAAGLHLAIYASNTGPVALDTWLMIVSVAGFLCAAFVLIRKTASAIRIAGWVLLCFFALGFLPAMQQSIDEVVTSAPGTPVMKTLRDDLGTLQWAVSAVWLGYLIRSRRVREVYGRNFGRHSESSAGGMPT